MSGVSAERRAARVRLLTGNGNSVMANFRASDARTTASFAPLACGRRRNTSNCLEGKFCIFAPAWPTCMLTDDRGRYAEVLESTQFTLISTIHKLYAMVRSGEQWDLGEPMLNDRGQPIVHNIAAKLGCIRPNSDIDLPVHDVFPEDEAGLQDLVRQLREQETEQDFHKPSKRSASPTSYRGSRKHNRASSSEPDHSDYEDGHGPRSATTAATSVASRSPGGIGLLSPPSLPPYKDFEMDQPAAMFPDQGMQGFAWDRSTGMDFLDQSSSYSSMDMLSQGLLESEFGSLKPHVVPYQNRQVMMGMGDPMMFAGYEDETMKL
jgi:hypothetical protein